MIIDVLGKGYKTCCQHYTPRRLEGISGRKYQGKKLMWLKVGCKLKKCKPVFKVYTNVIDKSPKKRNENIRIALVDCVLCKDFICEEA